MFSYFIGKIFGKDIRSFGDGNPGGIQPEKSPRA
ncbi:MAG: hypothetical protein ACP5GW_01980 [Caldisericaceae bacterium]